MTVENLTAFPELSLRFGRNLNVIVAENGLQHFDASSERSEAERMLAALSTEAKKLRVVLHMEQRPTRSCLWPRAVKPADIRQKLKQRLKPVDRYPLVSGIAWPNGVPWAVARSSAASGPSR